MRVCSGTCKLIQIFSVQEEAVRIKVCGRNLPASITIIGVISVLAFLLKIRCVRSILNTFAILPFQISPTLLSYRPSNPFVVPFLVHDKGIPLDPEINNQILPYYNYVYFICLALVGPISELTVLTCSYYTFSNRWTP